MSDSILNIISEVSSLNPLADFISAVHVGEWHEIEKKDATGEPTGVKEDRLTVYFKLADENMIVWSRGKAPFVNVRRGEDGPELVNYPYTPEGKTRPTWSPRLHNFYAKGEEFKDFRNLAPMLVLIAIHRGLIK